MHKMDGVAYMCGCQLRAVRVYLNFWFKRSVCADHGHCRQDVLGTIISIFFLSSPRVTFHPEVLSLPFGVVSRK